MLRVYFILFMNALILIVGLHARAATPPAPVLERPPQFVLISFDGSYSDQFWKESFNLADKANAQFSYFVSGVYFIEHNDNKLYQAPGHSLGSSDIGFGDNNLQDISTRIENVWQALERKFDIGSHVNGHFDGTKWSEQDWISEFTQFNRFVEKVFSQYPSLKESFASQWEQRISGEIKGFRAPLLAESPGISGTLEKFHYLYDSSKVLNGQWPYQLSDGIWNVGLSEIALAGSSRHTIAMDYNVLYGQCDGHFNPKNGGECLNLNNTMMADFEKQTYDSYIQAFLKSYYGNRAPISIGHHFSLFNRGVYWRALQKFTYAVCNQPEVKCVTHTEMIRWIESQKQTVGASFINSLNKSQFNVATSTQVRLALAPQSQATSIRVAARSLHQMRSQNLVDEVEQHMLRGDLPEAHMLDHEAMDLESVRYSPE